MFCTDGWNVHLHTGIPELVTLLRARGQQVFLVSGGFRQIIHPLAQSLDIPLTHVFANTITHDVSVLAQSSMNYVWLGTATHGATATPGGHFILQVRLTCLPAYTCLPFP